MEATQSRELHEYCRHGLCRKRYRDLLRHRDSHPPNSSDHEPPNEQPEEGWPHGTLPLGSLYDYMLYYALDTS
jgi:hypothetical protein